MPNIQFIIQGENASEIALKLKNYLESEWQTEAKTKLSDTPTIYSADTQTRGGFDPDFIEIVVSLYGGYKLFKDINEVVTDSKKLITWLEEILTNKNERIWLSINGIPYPVKINELDNIAFALEKEEKIKMK